MVIKAIEESDIKGLNHLPPKDWELDYEAFLNVYFGQAYFYAFIMIEQGKVVGTGNVFFNGKVAWLANIMVHENSRGRGLGFKMTAFLVDFLNGKKCETQLLIATELGAPVYQKNGFKKLVDYQGFQTVEAYDFTNTELIRRLEYSNLNAVLTLDYSANGENRKHLIEKYYEAGFGYFTPKNELLGFYLPHFGRGLILSKTEEAGLELLHLKHAVKGRVTCLPIENQKGINYLENKKIRKGVRFTRMILGKPLKWNPNYIYSYGSGYCG